MNVVEPFEILVPGSVMADNQEPASMGNRRYSANNKHDTDPK